MPAATSDELALRRRQCCVERLGSSGPGIGDRVCRDLLVLAAAQRLEESGLNRGGLRYSEGRARAGLGCL